MMAEGDASVYNKFKDGLLNGSYKLAADTFKVILVNSDYSFSADGTAGYANVDSFEITSTGYNAGGCTLASLAVAQNDTDDTASWDAADLTWASLGTDNITGAIVYDDTVTATGDDVADPLLIYWEIATNANGGNYTLQWNASGLLVLS